MGLLYSCKANNSSTIVRELKPIKTAIKSYWNRLLNAVISGGKISRKERKFILKLKKDENNINNNKWAWAKMCWIKRQRENNKFYLYNQINKSDIT